MPMPLVYPKDRPPRFSTGLSDYRKLREGGYVYVDKTTFIAEVLESTNEVVVVPRPRRFGKTLNMSTLRHFLERQEPKDPSLFEDTAIWNARDPNGRRHREEHFQRYPVVYLTFKDVKHTTWDKAWMRIRALIQAELERLADRYAFDTVALSPLAGAALQRKLQPDATTSDLEDTLGQVLDVLRLATGENGVLLVDEYDAPLHAAHTHGYWDEAVEFFGPFLSSGLKDHKHLHRGVITGILKVAKENIFSDLNNPRVHTILKHPMREAFGFTEVEVGELAHLAGQDEHIDAIRRWYNGYRFGDPELGPSTIYNPWSILEHLASGKTQPRPYWLGTSANVLVRDLLVRQAATHGDDVEALLRDACVTCEVDENLELRRVTQSPNALWSLLLFSGYLTAKGAEVINGTAYYDLCVPNEEVHQVYRKTFVELVRQVPTGNLDELITALLSGNARSLEEQLGRILVTMASFHDFAGQAPERVYHAFVLGLIAQLGGTHLIRSNREAGHGRADLMVIPKRAGAPAAILELKVVRQDDDELPEEIPEADRGLSAGQRLKRKLQRALDDAERQIRNRSYAAALADHDVSAIHGFAVAFHRKRVLVRGVAVTA